MSFCISIRYQAVMNVFGKEQKPTLSDSFKFHNISLIVAALKVLGERPFPFLYFSQNVFKSPSMFPSVVGHRAVPLAAADAHARTHVQECQGPRFRCSGTSCPVHLDIISLFFFSSSNKNCIVCVGSRAHASCIDRDNPRDERPSRRHCIPYPFSSPSIELMNC